MPGPGTAQHGFLLDRDGGVLFTSDLFVHPDGSELRFVPGEYMHDPEQARRTAEGLLDLEFAVLCTGHGAPVTDDPKAAILGALAA
jgi:glyoxylase-like metal-dependent hydrolase (beta-lactamase superfamily II)